MPRIGELLGQLLWIINKGVKPAGAAQLSDGKSILNDDIFPVPGQDIEAGSVQLTEPESSRCSGAVTQTDCNLSPDSKAL